MERYKVKVFHGRKTLYPRFLRFFSFRNWNCCRCCCCCCCCRVVWDMCSKVEIVLLYYYTSGFIYVTCTYTYQFRRVEDINPPELILSQFTPRENVGNHLADGPKLSETYTVNDYTEPGATVKRKSIQNSLSLSLSLCKCFGKGIKSVFFPDKVFHHHQQYHPIIKNNMLMNQISIQPLRCINKKIFYLPIN